MCSRNRRLNMVKYTIISILVLLMVTGVVLMALRRKHVTAVSRLENEKISMQNTPINEELTKIKALNMNGQTEEMFERWRAQHDEIKVGLVKRIDDLLFETEDCIKRFNFAKASRIEKEIAEYIKHALQDQERIRTEVNELVGSKEKNLVELEELNEQYRAARKTLLAHQHAFGVALPALEERLESFVPRSEACETLMKEGNYLQARELVLILMDESKEFFHLINEIPALLIELQTNIPGALKELRAGHEEMEEQKYYLRHLELEQAFDAVEIELTILVDTVKTLEIDTVQQRVTQLNDDIDYFYDVLEKEVMAKQYIDKNCEPMFNTIINLIKKTRDLSIEADYVQQSYRLPEYEAETPKTAMKQLEFLQKRYDTLTIQVNEEKSAYTSLQADLVAIQRDVEVIADEQNQFANRLRSLRVNENDARTRVEDVTRILQDAERLLYKSNLPGVPEDMETNLDEVAEYIYVVSQNLQEVPLNMDTVHANLQVAEHAAQDVLSRSRKMVEDVRIIERLIQYGNRYRASHPELHQSLNEVEHAFNHLQYTKALEEAATAVEKVEPDALERVQKLVTEDLKKIRY